MAEYTLDNDPRFGKKVLRVENVLKRFGDNVVLDHVSFDVRQHETVALPSPTRASTRTRPARALAWSSSSSTCSRT